MVPKFLQPSGAILDSGGLVFSDGSGWQYGRDEAPTKSPYNYVRPTDYGSSYCVMVTRALPCMSKRNANNAFTLQLCLLVRPMQ